MVGSISEQVAGAQSLVEVRRGEDQDAVVGPAAPPLEADDNALSGPRVILRQRAQSLQVIRGDLGAALASIATSMSFTMKSTSMPLASRQ